MVLFFTHIPFVVNHTINATPLERLQQHPLLFTTNHTDRTFFVWRLNSARPPHPGHSSILLRSEIPSSMCAKLRTVATSNNRDHPTRSLYYCLFAPHAYVFVLRAHPVRGESHNQRNTTGEVAAITSACCRSKHEVFSRCAKSVWNEISHLRNLWLRAICACADKYSRSRISQLVTVQWSIKYADNWCFGLWLGFMVYLQGSGLELLQGLGQLCPNQMTYWAKKHVTVLTRAAHWRPCQWGSHIEWLTLILANYI